MTTLILPVEIKVREFDAKLLLALAACERGFRVILGDQRETRLFSERATSGVLLSKSINSVNQVFHRRVRANGLRVVALDEEGLVYRSWSEFLKEYVPPGGLECLDRYLTWGPEQASRLAETRSDAGIPIVPTGNPRIDLLRPELRGFYKEDRDRLRGRFGDFVLVNTNFGTIIDFAGPDGFLAILRRMQIIRSEADEMFYRGLLEHNKGLVDHFIALLERLDRDSPVPIVLRPHPAEDPRFWKRSVGHLRRVSVNAEGPAAAWIHAARAVVHNGCTTGIEAFVLGVPAISYEPIRSDLYDLFLPGRLSSPASEPDEVLRLIANPASPRADQVECAARYMTALAGPLAADLIVGACTFDATSPTAVQSASSTVPGFAYRRARWKRTVKKLLKGIIPGYWESHRREVAADHKFAPMSSVEVQEKIRRLQRVSGRFDGIQALPVRGTRAMFALSRR